MLVLDIERHIIHVLDIERCLAPIGLGIGIGTQQTSLQLGNCFDQQAAIGCDWIGWPTTRERLTLLLGAQKQLILFPSEATTYDTQNHDPISDTTHNKTLKRPIHNVKYKLKTVHIHLQTLECTQDTSHCDSHHTNDMRSHFQVWAPIVIATLFTADANCNGRKADNWIQMSGQWGGFLCVWSLLRFVWGSLASG